MAVFTQQSYQRVRAANLNDLETIRNIKRELFRMRREIDGMKNREEKKDVLKTYAELLTRLEIGKLKT